MLLCPSTAPALQSATQSATLYYRVLLQHFSARCYSSTTQSTTEYHSSTTLYYRALITPALFCTTKCCSSNAIQVLLSTTKYYSSTTLYYKVLLSIAVYYRVLLLLCTTQVLPCTTKYCSSTAKSYSSTTLYHKLSLQDCSVAQSVTPVPLYYKMLLLPSTTKCYSNGNKLLTTYGEGLRVWLLQYYSVVLLQ